MNAITKMGRKMTVTEFLQWDPGDGQTWQLVDGEPQAMAPASMDHAVLLNELAALLRNHLLQHRPDCFSAINGGVVPRARSAINARIPDLAVICSRADRTGPLMREPLILCEILSPSNEAETTANIWAYTTIPSVQEILILDGTAIAADVLRRNADGTWPDDPIECTDGRLELASIGFTTDLTTLYRGNVYDERPVD